MAVSHFLHIHSATIVEMLLIVISVFCLHEADAQAGACYGTLGDNLPEPTRAISLCNEYNITRLRLYNPNQTVLQALEESNSNISLIVGVANEDIPGIAQDTTVAESWVRNNILNYGNVNFRYVAVGNEISPSNSRADIAQSVAPAMQNIYNALTSTGLGEKVKVSTAVSMEVLGQSYPPSAGEFKSDISSFINPIVEFLVNTKSPFLVNVYPYFAYISNTNDIRLDYALFTSPSTVVEDGEYQYQNLFDAMVDAVHAALEKAGGANVEVVVSETGWPSAGGTATSIENAHIYNSNLIESVEKGTPRKPEKAIEAYLFDLIDENQKSPELEKHWGIFLPDKQPKYTLTFL